MDYFWIEKNDFPSWESKTSGLLSISCQYFFNNSNIILNQNLDFKENIISNLTGEIPIKPILRHTQRSENKKKYKKYYKGINIKKLNDELRIKLKSNSNLLFEVYNEEGVFYTSNGTKGFDFACLDSNYNLINLWNLCFGRKSLYNGKDYWEETLKSNSFLESAASNFNVASYPLGQDIPSNKEVLTILGELQFGNWGLAYRDLFKLLHADALSGVDLFVYVTAHNNLLSYASDGIVSYSDTISILNEFSSLIKIPIWVIGLDIHIE